MHTVFEVFCKMSRVSTEISALAFQGPWGLYFFFFFFGTGAPSRAKCGDKNYSLQYNWNSYSRSISQTHGYATAVREVGHNELSSLLHQESKKK